MRSLLLLLRPPSLCSSRLIQTCYFGPWQYIDFKSGASEVASTCVIENQLASSRNNLQACTDQAKVSIGWYVIVLLDALGMGGATWAGFCFGTGLGAGSATMCMMFSASAKNVHYAIVCVSVLCHVVLRTQLCDENKCGCYSIETTSRMKNADSALAGPIVAAVAAVVSTAAAAAAGTPY